MIQEAVRNIIIPELGKHHFSVSIGVKVWSKETSIEEMIRKANLYNETWIRTSALF
jgi:hypothetical protein